MIGAGVRWGDVRAGTMTESSGITKHLLVKRGTNPGDVALCGASDTPLGPALETVTRVGGNLEYGFGAGSYRMVASEAIDPGEEITTAADGKIGPLPTSGGGTAYAYGRLDPDDPGATADGHVVVVQWYGAPELRNIPAGS